MIRELTERARRSQVLQLVFQLVRERPRFHEQQE